MQDRKRVVLPADLTLLTNPAGRTVDQRRTARCFAVCDRNRQNGFNVISPSDLYQYQMTKDSPFRCSSYCSPSCSWKAKMTWDQTASADA